MKYHLYSFKHIPTNNIFLTSSINNNIDAVLGDNCLESILNKSKDAFHVFLRRYPDKSQWESTLLESVDGEENISITLHEYTKEFVDAYTVPYPLAIEPETIVERNARVDDMVIFINDFMDKYPNNTTLMNLIRIGINLEEIKLNPDLLTKVMRN